MRFPLRTLAVIVLLQACSWWVARGLRVDGDFVSLLPSASAAAQRFRSVLSRKGGAASTIVVVAESRSRQANQRLLDELERRISALPHNIITSVQAGPRAERAFFSRWRWLFVGERELMLVACELERARTRHLPGFFEPDESCAEAVDEERAQRGLVDSFEPPAPGAEIAGTTTQTAASGNARSSPLASIRQRIEARIASFNRYEDGYFCNDTGTRCALLIQARSAGMGEFSADALLERVRAEVQRAEPLRFDPTLSVGFAGDIPNAVAERNSLIEDMTLVSLLAAGVVLLVILSYFRSFTVLFPIFLATGLGCSVAFALASLWIGHLNMATSFLGSIVLGNGINVPIFYVARYRELRSSGLPLTEALIQAASDCQRSTWLAALSASGAYAALSVTSFRGFSEFGLIGGVGMLACWFAAFLVCPPALAALERLPGGRLTRPASDFDPKLFTGLARFVELRPRLVLACACALAVAVAVPIAGYLRQPWEYDFAKLRSASSSRAGAGHYSAMADEIFGSRGSPELLLTPNLGDVPQLLLEIQQKGGTAERKGLVEKVATAYDYLGGQPELVARKLLLLDRIRSDLDRVARRLDAADKEFAKDFRPPEYLRALGAEDLPPLLRERFSEKSGAFGTAVFIDVDRELSRSRGENLLRISDFLESLRDAKGDVLPNASRASVFAEMIRSMALDAPRAVLLAAGVVTVICLLLARALLPFAAVLGSLLLGAWLTVGLAALLDIRLNFLNFVALPLTFGIGVEYAINLCERIRLLGGNVALGLRSAGGALSVCSLTTMLGYGALLVGDNLALRSFGIYAVLGELSCMSTALLVIPAALVLWQRSR